MTQEVQEPKNRNKKTQKTFKNNFFKYKKILNKRYINFKTESAPPPPPCQAQWIRRDIYKGTL